MKAKTLYTEKDVYLSATLLQIADLKSSRVKASAQTPAGDTVPVELRPAWIPGDVDFNDEDAIRSLQDASAAEQGAPKQSDESLKDELDLPDARKRGVFSEDEYLLLAPHIDVPYIKVFLTELDVEGNPATRLSFFVILNPPAVADSNSSTRKGLFKREKSPDVEDAAARNWNAQRAALDGAVPVEMPVALWDDGAGDVHRAATSRQRFLQATLAEYGKWRALASVSVVLSNVFFLYDKGDVVRFSCKLPAGYPLRPDFSCSDECCNAVDNDVRVVDDRICMAPDSSRAYRYLTVSVCVPAHQRGLLLGVKLPRHHSLPEGDATFCFIPSWHLRDVRDDWCDRRANACDNGSYPRWLQRHRSGFDELRRQSYLSQDFAIKPLFSIVTPVFKTSPAYLRQMIDSVLAQSYAKFELVLVNVSPDDEGVAAVLASYDDERIRTVVALNEDIATNTNVGIAAAKGDYIAFVDHDDFIEPDVLFWYAAEINECPDADLLYCNEDLYVEGKYEACKFKMAWNPERLFCGNYVCHMLMVSRYVLDKTQRSGSEMAGAQDYDLTFKAAQVARDIRRVSNALYHWRSHEQSTALNRESKPYALYAGQKAIQSYFDANGIDACIDIAKLPFSYRVRYAKPQDAPFLSIAVASRESVSQDYIDTLKQKTRYDSFEIVVACPNANMLTGIVPVGVLGEGACWTAAANDAVAASVGERVVVLKAGYLPAASDWLWELAGPLSRPGLGCTGPLLSSADGIIESAGLILRQDGHFSHANRGLVSADLGYMDTLQHPCDYTALDSSCFAFRREDFEGFDEQFSCELTAPDFCLRLHAKGLMSACVPYVEFRGPEALSCRDLTSADARSAALQEHAYFCLKHADVIARGDFYLDENLDAASDLFALKNPVDAFHTLRPSIL